MDDHAPSRAEVEAMVRAYVGRVARRYVPLAIALVVLVLVAIVMPTKTPTSVEGFRTGSGFDTTDVAGDSAVLSSDADTQAVTPGEIASAAAVPRATARTARSGTSATAGPITTVTPFAAGRTRSGVTCGPGVRQVTWSPYAPPCVPSFSGNNGGATSHGVTKDQVTLTYRVAASAQDAAIGAILGTANLDDATYVADLQTYVGYFNKQFELYGRQVKLVTFNARGDYIQEHQGLDQGQAQADAQNAKTLGAFLDITFPLKGSHPYWEALAEQKIVAMGPVGFPYHWYDEHSPYWYSVLPVGQDVANWLINATCLRLAGQKATFAGQQDFQLLDRAFGLVTPDNPEYIEIGNYIESHLTACGARPKTKISYTINVARYGDESTSVAAQLKAANVTTVLCYCDPVFTVPLGYNADGQRYYPEWWQPWWGDPQGQQNNQTEFNNHAITNGATWPANKDNEAYRVYKLAKPDGEPQGLYFTFAYQNVLLTFDALQHAGPDLNPQTFEKAWTSIPAADGQAGRLVWAPGRYSPLSGSPAAWWTSSTVSNFNNRNGAWLSCESGRFFPFDLTDKAAWGTPKTPLGCFKK